MNFKKISNFIFNAAINLDESLLKYSSSKYPKDLGSWGIEETNLDELKRHLSKLVVELKVYDLNEKEFPTLKGKNLLEVEINSSLKDEKKVLDVLKRIKAFPLERHHIVNLKKSNIGYEDDDNGYIVNVDNQTYIEVILNGKKNYSPSTMEEIHDLIGGNYYGVQWKNITLSDDKKQIIAIGIFTDDDLKKSNIKIIVKRKDNETFNKKELSWIKLK